MAELPEDHSKKIIENANSVFPNMDLKQIGKSTHHKTQQGIPDEDFKITDPTVGVVEEEEPSQVDQGTDEVEGLKTKLKHVNIVTDSDEFNHLKTNSSNNNNSNNLNSDFIDVDNIVHSRHNTITANPLLEETPIAEEDIRAEDDDASLQKLSQAALKLNEAAQLIENSLVIDKGEFDCNSPLKVNVAAHRRPSLPQVFVAQAQVEPLAEEPEKEEEEEEKKNGHENEKLHKHTGITGESKDRVDICRVEDIHHNVQTKILNEFDDVQPIAEEDDNKDEDQEDAENKSDDNNALTEAKEERDQQKEFIKKIVAGDKIKETEKLMQIVEASEAAVDKQTAPIPEEEEDPKE